MKAVLENRSSNDHFSLRQIRLNHLAKVLIFPFILWVMYISHYIDIVAFVHSQIFYGIAVVKRYSKDNYFIQISSFALVLVLGSLLLRHQVLGFGNNLILKEQLISSEAVPYSLWFNKDSILVCLSLIIVFYKPRSLGRTDIVQMLFMTVLGVIVLSGFALSIGFIKLDIKYVSFFGTWLLFNVISVITQEAFFRLFLLESIIRLYKGKYNVLIASILVAIFFAWMHYFYGNATYMFLAFIGSIIYSYVYIACGRRLEVSVFCHLMVNVVHMLFFTYPFLKIV